MKHLTLIRGKLSISQTLLIIKFFHGVLQNILFSSWFSLQKQLGIANIVEEKNNVGTYLRINMGLHSLCFLYSLFPGQGLTDCIFF